MFIVVMTWLSLGTHGYISLESLISNWKPVGLQYEIRVVFKDRVPADSEVLAPIPLIDGQEIPAFREALRRSWDTAEVVETDRGKFVRITPRYTGDQLDP